MKKKITVIGSGGTALAAAVTFTANGHEVTLTDTPEHQKVFDDIEGKGGILLRGNGVRGQVRPSVISTDVHGSVKGSGIVIVSTQAVRHEEIAKLIAGDVNEDQVIVIVPGNAGSLIFDRVFKEENVSDRPVLLELQGNLFPNRITGPAEVNSGAPLRKKRASAFPAKDTDLAIERLEGVLEIEKARNVFETTVNTPNIINHLVSTILNAAQIDKAGSKFGLFIDGLTPTVLKGLDVAYGEVESVLDKLGYFKMANPAEHLRKVADPDNHDFDVFRSLLGPDSLEHRYVTEDAPCAVSLLVSLADLVGVEVPFNKALLTIVSKLNGVDYYGVGRTIANFGLKGRTTEEIERYLNEGDV
ncbi:MAG: NAD/NADP octopine/nopaline dehydrogenase family protein [Lachnospiraceae bacterium]|nr:NAD/NADP octopine/nopaline dehydrogenase family protein [Lachnospiraceae bacterium]